MATHDRNLIRAATLRKDIEYRTGLKTGLETRSTTCFQAAVHYAMLSHESWKMRAAHALVLNRPTAMAVGADAKK